MQQAERGFRSKLDAFLNVNNNITVDISAVGSSVYDFSCFGVDANNKLSDDRYMVFYNQLASPNREISLNLQNGRALFDINLAALPGGIKRLVFTVSIDGGGVMSQISRMGITIGQQGKIVLASNFNGSYFAEEKAVIALEFYYKEVWRVNIVGQGFNGGLSDLLKYYGGEEESSSPAPNRSAAPAAYAPVKSAAPAGSVGKVSLEKKLAKASELVSLAKHVAVSLKKNNLENIVARVGLVLDASGSMSNSYMNGTVQEIINRILPLAVQFDDDGELDAWMFGDWPLRLNSINLDNYRAAVPLFESNGYKSGLFSVLGSVFLRSAVCSHINEVPSRVSGAPSVLSMRFLCDKVMGYGNNEPRVMKMVIDEYRNSSLPVYIVFISDGGIYLEKEITEMIVEASKLPIFWQFVGVSGSNYGILEHLDDMEGRFIDNANFFALDDFMSVDKTELYNRLLNEFPSWLREARAKGIIK